jgi:hypothetical protein
MKTTICLISLFLVMSAHSAATLNNVKGLLRMSLEAPLSKMINEAKESAEKGEEDDLPYYQGRIGLY